MSRPRIRSLKPETWQDEKVGRLSRDARLLFIGLITLVDDDGRFRALPAIILGHVFPFDEDAAKRLPKWMGELTKSRLVVRYEHDGIPYGVLPHFRDHQRISHPKASLLPSPNGAVAIESVRT